MCFFSSGYKDVNGSIKVAWAIKYNFEKRPGKKAGKGRFFKKDRPLNQLKTKIREKFMQRGSFLHNALP
jgi:hypothetical protein